MSDPKFEKVWVQNIKGMLRGVPFSDEMKAACLREFEASLSEENQREKDARRMALEEAAKVAETGTFQGGFQTRGDERRAFDIARRIRALQSEER